MIQRILIFALIGGLVYLNYTTPKEEQHRAATLAELQETRTKLQKASAPW